MLLEYGTSNFLSFKDEAYIDLRPAKGKVLKRYPDNYVTLDTGEKALKTSVIVGENAGGKSNFVESLGFLQALMSRSDRPACSYRNFVNSGNIVRGQNGLISATKSISQQDFSFVVAREDDTLHYSLSVDYLGIVSESLRLQDSKDSDLISIFSNRRLGTSRSLAPEAESRMKDDVIVQSEYDFVVSDYNGTIPFELLESGLQGHLDSRQLSVVWLAMLGEKSCRALVDAVTKDIVIAQSGNPRYFENGIGADSIASVMRDERYSDIVRLIDSSIIGLEVDDEKPLYDSSIVRKDGRGKSFSRPVVEDSAGVRQFLYWAYCIFLVVNEDKTIVADEIDSAINPVLSDRVLSYINGRDHRGQFIFTTHNIFNLTLRTNMKEQINFVTKDPLTLTSSMYSLADFPDIRYDVKEELYEFYLKGALGGTVYA